MWYTISTDTNSIGDFRNLEDAKKKVKSLRPEMLKQDTVLIIEKYTDDEKLIDKYSETVRDFLE